MSWSQQKDRSVEIFYLFLNFIFNVIVFLSDRFFCHFIFAEIEGFIKSPLTSSHVVDVGVCVVGFSINNTKIQCEVRGYDPDAAPKFERGEQVIIQGDIVRKSTFVS